MRFRIHAIAGRLLVPSTLLGCAQDFDFQRCVVAETGDRLDEQAVSALGFSGSDLTSAISGPRDLAFSEASGRDGDGFSAVWDFHFASSGTALEERWEDLGSSGATSDFCPLHGWALSVPVTVSASDSTGVIGAGQGVLLAQSPGFGARANVSLELTGGGPWETSAEAAGPTSDVILFSTSSIWRDATGGVEAVGQHNESVTLFTWSAASP